MQTSSPKLIRIGHSPDPDDAFMFYALAHEKIPMRGFKVEHVIEDIESLNQRALEKGVSHHFREMVTDPFLLEVTAVSCHAYAYLADRYLVMRSGASVGDGYGPIIVAKSHKATRPQGHVPHDNKSAHVACGMHPVAKKIAVPGKLTTAYLVLQLYAQNQDGGRRRAEGDRPGFAPSSILQPPFDAVFVPFDQVFDAVKSGEVDYGLVIHEGQITHAQHGLEKVLDLGAWWHEKTKLPLPLGIDVIRRDLGPETIAAFSKLFKESIEYALSHREDALEYAGQFGRGISEDLNDRFVGMYVNKRTLDIGKDGEAGFKRLMDEAYQHGIIPKKVNLKFV